MPVQASVGSDAVLQISYKSRVFCTAPEYPASPPLPKIASTVTRKPMSTPPQGASGPSGHIGFRPAFGPPVSSRNHTAPELALTILQQIPQEQSISNQIRRLNVRLLVDVFNLRANKLSGYLSTLLKGYSHNTRYYRVPMTKYHPSNPPEGVICDKREV